MSYGTVIGSAAGSFIPGVGTAVGAGVGTIFDSVFGNIDKGSWQGNIFVPGDISSRQSQVNIWLQQRGLTWADVDQETITSFLYVESGWQGNITSYLDKIVEQKRLNTRQTIGDLNSDPVIPSPLSIQTAKIPTWLIVVGLGFLGVYLFKHSWVLLCKKI